MRGGRALPLDCYCGHTRARFLYSTLLSKELGLFVSTTENYELINDVTQRHNLQWYIHSNIRCTCHPAESGTLVSYTTHTRQIQLQIGAYRNNSNILLTLPCRARRWSYIARHITIT